MGSIGSALLGRETRGERQLREFSAGSFGSRAFQKFLPVALRRGTTDPILQSGIEGIGELIANPGGLSPTVAEAIGPRLSLTSEGIAQNFRGIRSEQSGALARTNAPVSIRTALDSALNVAQSRAQRGARREALSESEQLRRADLSQVFSILDAILQFTSAGRGVSAQGLTTTAQSSAQRQAATQAFIGSLFTQFGLSGGGGGGGAFSFGGGAAGGGGAAPTGALGVVASGSRFKESFEPIASDEILTGIKNLPVYEWSYKGEGVRHVGPMAEDFMATFGLGGSPDYIQFVDAMGTLMAATQSLARKVERLESPN